MKKHEPEQDGMGQAVIDGARQIWLAGLGAVSKAELEGSKFFEALVKEGEAIEARTRNLAGSKVEAVKSKASESWDKMEEMFQDRVSRALNRLGVPTYDDIHKLTKQVETLDKRIKELITVREKRLPSQRSSTASATRS
jgi:poly(hydroxyalkanoate) granule-associated protein